MKKVMLSTSVSSVKAKEINKKYVKANPNIGSHALSFNGIGKNTASSKCLNNCTNMNSASPSECFLNGNQTNRQNKNVSKKCALKNVKTKHHFVSQNIPSSVTQKTNLITYSELKSLSDKDPNEILLSILGKYSGIVSFVTQSNVECNFIAYFIIVLGKACSSDLSANIHNLIKTINNNSKSVLNQFQKYLASLQKQMDLHNFHFDSIINLTVFLQKFQSILPSSSSEFIAILLPLLQLTCMKYLKKNEKLYQSVSEKLKEVDEQNQYFLKHNTLYEVKQKSEKEKLHLQDPPTNFRSLPVLPTVDDIKLPCLFLRPNIVEGRYRDVEHYLDVQYRLLREDYVKPLRDGISEYLISKKNRKSFKSSDIKVYNDVFIISKKCMKGNILHQIKFPSKGFSKINWEYSKRFLTGNLLCFSSNDFQTVAFASVAIREPKDLCKGLLWIHFEKTAEIMLNFAKTIRYVVIETGAFFEAYRHNLNALLHLNEECLPFKNYIVDVQKNISKPQYLQVDTVFDIRPLFLPLSRKYIKNGRYGSIQYEFPKYVSPSMEFVKVTHDNCWPTATELQLEDSQYVALKTAIMKEFALIQGPPGTGKTYVGLRIVQLLLHNLNAWFSSDKNSLPILIVCFTNHALDQFLEGLLLFTTKLARIGGRSSNEAVLRYQLYNLKKCVYRDINQYHKLAMNCQREITVIESKIIKTLKCTQNATENVLTLEELCGYMTHTQYCSLTQGIQDSKNISCIMYNWLQITPNLYNHFVQNDKEYNSENFDTSTEISEDIESEDEVDIEYIESQRNVDFYDELIFKQDLKFKKNEESECIIQENKDFKMTEYIEYCLQCCGIMNEDYALQVKNIWNLEISQRWHLYKYWLQKYIKEKEIILLNLQKDLETKLEELKEIYAEEDMHILQGKQIVGMTTTGAAKYRHLVQRLNPAILIVEEAAEILESHIITSLAPNTQHIILIGDQQQLRPTPTVHELVVKYDMDVSLFERMINNGIDYCRLSIQHRMRPDIVDLIVPHIYPDLKNHDVVKTFENIKGISKNIFFVSHNITESSEKESRSKINQHEARFMIQFCKYLIQQGYESSQITILTTYSGQLFALKSLVNKEHKVRISIVDNYQGEENDIILISFVRSNKEGVVGFLKISNRICVALSRAKKGLFCIGNFELLSKKCNLWKNIVETLTAKKCIGVSLQLTCQNHPNIHTDVANALDFKNVPNGGCLKKCEYRLNCGHVCPLICHPYDQAHKSILCKKPCVKICERGHNCKKMCFEKCYCKVLIDRTLQKCGHIVHEFCGKPEKEIICRSPCLKICENGHLCSKLCFEKCGLCPILIDRTLQICGHTINEICGKPENEILCQEPCVNVCKKGHPCSKKCFEICDPCETLIDITLKLCGHTVKDYCGKLEENIKCRMPCTKICNNGHQCNKKCFEDCGSCKILIDKKLEKCGHIIKVACYESSSLHLHCHEPCVKFCANGHPCSKKCYQYCGRCNILMDKTLEQCGHTVKSHCWIPESAIMCDFKCEKTLPCSHQCSNKCSEICTKQCLQPCLKTCKNSHPCLKACFEICMCTSIICKMLEHCGHMVKVPCAKSEDEIKCYFRCKKLLQCAHNCTNKCSDPCVKYCKQLKEAKSPICGHSIQVPCYIANDTTLLYKKCAENFQLCPEQCNVDLPCGHKCKGTCGKCFQGRLHIACNEVCERILICGHKCQSICSACCPPCQYPCESICVHLKCKRKCGEPCVSCKEKCEWSCIHKKCTNFCHEICNREPCDEPCSKILSCSHPCNGFCSEPCPEECILCLSKENHNVLLKFENNTKYVVLEDCNHVFESALLDKWMKNCTDNDKIIFQKICPKCNTVIRKNFRYSNIIKASCLQMEKIKQILKINSRDNNELQKILLKKITTVMPLLDSVTSHIFFKFLSSNIINIQKLTNIENIISIATELLELETNDNIFKFCDLDEFQELIQYKKITKQWLMNFICKNFQTLSDHQLLQLTYEFCRLKLICKLLTCGPKIFESQIDDFKNCTQYLLNYTPFNEECINHFMDALQILTSNSASSDDNTDLLTPVTFPILKLMNMSDGHWYVCPKGHVYSVMEFVQCEKRCYHCIQNTAEIFVKKYSNLSNVYTQSCYGSWPQYIKLGGNSDIKNWIHRETHLWKQTENNETKLKRNQYLPFKTTQSKLENKHFQKSLNSQLTRLGERRYQQKNSSLYTFHAFPHTAQPHSQIKDSEKPQNSQKFSEFRSRLREKDYRHAGNSIKQDHKDALASKLSSRLNCFSEKLNSSKKEQQCTTQPRREINDSEKPSSSQKSSGFRNMSRKTDHQHARNSIKQDHKDVLPSKLLSRSNCFGEKCSSSKKEQQCTAQLHREIKDSEKPSSSQKSGFRNTSSKKDHQHAKNSVKQDCKDNLPSKLTMRSNCLSKKKESSTFFETSGNKHGESIKSQNKLEAEKKSVMKQI